MTHNISAKAVAAKEAAKKKYSKLKCPHPNLVPLETHFAKRMKPNGPKFESFYDFSSNIMGAHISRIHSYYCPLCGKEILAPERSK